jgi:adenosylcobinamide-phosphate synthase
MVTGALFITAAALLFEAVFGYPDPLYRAIGHPVTWIGAVIALLERGLNQPTWPFLLRRLAGVLSLIILVATTAAVTLWLDHMLIEWDWGVALIILIAATLPAQRSLNDHVSAVAEALSNQGLEAGRKSVSMIVGRNTSVLDEAGVSRAAIESLAENFSDGVVSPLFWMAMLGFPGAAIYKAVNTADSMIGHKNERYLAFGWAAARFDDLINLPASRLAALWLTLAAFLLPQASGLRAIRTIARDARKHRSPNAGWPEAAMAGALGLALAGPRYYDNQLVDDAFMGNGRREATAEDIRRALRLYRLAATIEACVIFGTALALT